VALLPSLAEQVVLFSALQNLCVNPILFVIMDIGTHLAAGGAPLSAVRPARPRSASDLEKETWSLLTAAVGGGGNLADSSKREKAHARGVMIRTIARDAVKRVFTNTATVAVIGGFAGNLGYQMMRGQGADNEAGGLRLPAPLDALVALLGAMLPAAANLHLGLLLCSRAPPSADLPPHTAFNDASNLSADDDDDDDGDRRKASLLDLENRNAWRAPLALALLKLFLMPPIARALVTHALTHTDFTVTTNTPISLSVATTTTPPSATATAASATATAATAAALSGAFRRSDADRADLGTVAWLYGTLPTAPWIASFASAYAHHPKVASRTVAFSTLCSLPLLALSVALLFGQSESAVGPSVGTGGVREGSGNVELLFGQSDSAFGTPALKELLPTFPGSSVVTGRVREGPGNVGLHFGQSGESRESPGGSPSRSPEGSPGGSPGAGVIFERALSQLRVREHLQQHHHHTQHQPREQQQQQQHPRHLSTAAADAGSTHPAAAFQKSIEGPLRLHP